MYNQSSVNSSRNEDKFQAECFQWHWNTFPAQRRMLFHVQQKARNAIEGARFKAIGVVKGVSDFILLSPLGVVFIELKREDKKGRQSPEQIDFMNKVRALGYEYVIVDTLEQFKALILRHYAEV